MTDPNVNRELQRLRRSGLILPKNPNRAIQKVQSMYNGLQDGSMQRASQTRTAFSNASKGHRRTGSSVQMAIEKPRGPLDRFTQSQIPFKVNDVEERVKIRDLCRIYYQTHNLVPLLIDIYSRFPVQGATVKCRDPELQSFYEELFFDKLDYDLFLIDMGREFFTIGEVNSLASFSEILGVWDNEQIINPDDLTVSQSPFSKEQRFHLRVPQDIKDIIEHQRPRADYELLVREYPEIVEAARRETSGVSALSDDSFTGEGLEISNVLLSRFVNKATPWDLYGTPKMMSLFSLLNLEEGLMSAQKAIADRLYSPLILAKLGSPDLGDGQAWVPDMEELEAFNDLMGQAMSADFRFLTYHYGIDIQSVFGRESVPRFDDDFDRLERKMLQVWGIGESLISGSSSGAYASSALNSELVNQLMSSYQKNIRDHFKKRCEVVAEAQGHFDYKVSNGIRTPIMEDYLEVDDDGYETVKQRPKLLLPELNFKSITLRDEETERNFLMELKGAGIPISDRTILASVEIEFDDEVEKIQEEKVSKQVAEQQYIQKVTTILETKNLPLPPEILVANQQQQTPPPNPPMTPPGVSSPVGSDITSPINTPNLFPDPNAPAIAEQNYDTLPTAPPQLTSPGDPGVPPAAPTMAAQQPAAPSPGTGTDNQSDGALPSNWINTRPEISDNMRSRSSMRHDPGVYGKRGKLNEDSIREAINRGNEVPEPKAPEE